MTFIFGSPDNSVYDTHTFTTLQCKSCGFLHTVPVYCGNRFCPICSKPRMMRIRHRLTDMLNKVKLQKSQYFSHLVLTIRSQSDVKAMVRFLVRSFRKFRSRKVFKAGALGGAYVVELTHNDSGWHAHLHVVLHNYYIPQSELLSSWRSIVGEGGVFIKTIPKGAIINYLSKYMCKIELTGTLQEEASSALKGLRLFTVFGLWHDLLPGWTKIPFECPECCTVSWTLASGLSAIEHESISAKLQHKYG